MITKSALVATLKQFADWIAGVLASATLVNDINDQVAVPEVAEK